MHVVRVAGMGEFEKEGVEEDCYLGGEGNSQRGVEGVRRWEMGKGCFYTTAE